MTEKASYVLQAISTTHPSFPQRMKHMKKIASMFRHKCLYKCYVGWKNLTLKSKTELALKLKSSKHFIYRLQNNTLKLRFSSWKMYYADRKKLRKFVSRFMGGKQYRVLLHAFRLLRKHMVDVNMENNRFESANREELLQEVSSLCSSFFFSLPLPFLLLLLLLRRRRYPSQVGCGMSATCFFFTNPDTNHTHTHTPPPPPPSPRNENDKNDNAGSVAYRRNEHHQASDG